MRLNEHVKPEFVFDRDYIRNVDLDLLGKFFDKNKINELERITREYLKEGKGLENSGKNYYKNLAGNFEHRNEVYGEDLNNFFNRLLFAPNIAMLDHIVKNYDEFKNYKFIDNGCGIATMSVFLKMIGIDCYNYDAGCGDKNPNPMFGQVIPEQITLHEDILSGMDISISPVTDIPPTTGDVLLCSGIWVTSVAYNKLFTDHFKYFMVDSFYENNSHDNTNWRQMKDSEIFVRLKEYPTIKVYKKW